MDAQGFADRLWRAAVLLLATAVALYIGWQVIRSLLPFLVIGIALVGVIKLAVDGVGRRRW